MSSPADDLARMRGFMACVLLRRPLGELPPVELIERGHLGPLAYRLGVGACRNEYAASMVVSRRRAELLREVLAAFDAHGVRAALIKGIAYVGTLYPDAAERPMNDIDLLVPARSMADAMRAMTSLRFERVGMSRKLSGFYHALAFNRGGMMVELHRNIVQHHRTRFHAGELWRRATPDPLGSGAMRLDPVDELLVCALHIARHELSVPAINYVDVQRSVDRLDAAQRSLLDERARTSRVSRALRAVLGMTELLASGVAEGRPRIGAGDAVLPTTDDVLLARKPTRLRQIGQKLVLTEGIREIAGLGYSAIAAYRHARQRED